MKPPIPVKFGKNLRETEKQLDFALRDIYNRIGQVEQVIQPSSPSPSKVITAQGGPGVIPTGDSKIVIPTVDPGQGRLPLVTPVVPETVRIGGITPASMSIPSSYFLDLRLHNNDEHARHITADWLTLHDNSTPWKTVGISNVDEVNQNGTAGPIAGGRDRAAVFDREWVYLYVIYNSNTQDVSSLMSASSTAPTLPTGYNCQGWVLLG
jgi:hypothetical protein